MCSGGQNLGYFTSGVPAETWWFRKWFTGQLSFLRCGTIAAEAGEKQGNSNMGFSAFNLLLHICWVAEIAPGLITACVGDL